MRRIVFIAYEGATALDVAGPAEVFAAAARRLGADAYRVKLASVGGGLRETLPGLHLQTLSLSRLRPTAQDSIVVVGGYEAAVGSCMRDERVLGWLRLAASRVERMASVCSGAFVLAAAGLLNGRRAATHWLGCSRLQRLFPRVTVDRHAIFVVDGRFWTSAGVTTGIDMALAMVEKDHGSKIADSIAAELVLYVRRPGFQSQFSESLLLQMHRSDPMRQAVVWVRAHLRTADVESLAAAASLSLRTLHRRCLTHMGVTPAKLIDRLRVEHARTLLATGRGSAKQLASLCGFRTAANMKRVFMRELGITPGAYRLLHSRTAAADSEL
jgi:transcriptional regulator GlxA family with amidase domain